MCWPVAGWGIGHWGLRGGDAWCVQRNWEQKTSRGQIGDGQTEVFGGRGCSVTGQEGQACRARLCLGDARAGPAVLARGHQMSRAGAGGWLGAAQSPGLGATCMCWGGGHVMLSSHLVRASHEGALVDQCCRTRGRCCSQDRNWALRQEGDLERPSHTGGLCCPVAVAPPSRGSGVPVPQRPDGPGSWLWPPAAQSLARGCPHTSPAQRALRVPPRPWGPAVLAGAVLVALGA